MLRVLRTSSVGSVCVDPRGAAMKRVFYLLFTCLALNSAISAQNPPQAQAAPVIAIRAGRLLDPDAGAVL